MSINNEPFEREEGWQYIVTNEEKKAALPKQPNDEVWGENRWRSVLDNGKFDCDTPYRRRITSQPDWVANRDEVFVSQKQPVKTNNGWISVKDRLPENTNDVSLMIKESPKKTLCGYWNGIEWLVYGRHQFTVTHWQPLPPPPEPEKSPEYLAFEEWYKLTGSNLEDMPHESTKQAWIAAIEWSKKQNNKE